MSLTLTVEEIERMENFVIVEDSSLAPEFEPFDILFYRVGESGRYVAYREGNKLKVGLASEAPDNTIGAIIEMRRPSNDVKKILQEAAKFVFTYHAKHPQVPYWLLWEEAAEALKQGMAEG